MSNIVPILIIAITGFTITQFAAYRANKMRVKIINEILNTYNKKLRHLINTKILPYREEMSELIKYDFDNIKTLHERIVEQSHVLLDPTKLKLMQGIPVKSEVTTNGDDEIVFHLSYIVGKKNIDKILSVKYTSA